MTVRAIGLTSGQDSAETLRHAFAMLVQTAGTALEARSGIFRIGSGSDADLVAVSAMQAKVTAFYAWVDGTSAALQAGYPFINDGDVTLTFADGEAAVNRVDRVVARIKNNAYDASGVNTPSVEIVKGQASGAASPVPASSLLLWEVTVPAGKNAGNGGINFATARADKRVYTTAAGAILTVRSQSERDALSKYDGLAVYRSDTSPRRFEVWDGTAWQIVPIDGPLGTVLNHAVTGNPIASSVSGTETLITTTPSVTLRNSRAFKLTVRGQYKTTGSSAHIVRAKMGTAVGSPTLMDEGWLPTVLSADSFFQWQYEFVNTSGVDKSTQLTITGQGVSGQTVDYKGFSSGQFHVKMEDIGPASKHTGLASV